MEGHELCARGPINIAKLNAVAQSPPLSRFTLYRFGLVKRENDEGGMGVGASWTCYGKEILLDLS